MMNLMDVTILGFIEGFTEFLPVSSTGHMILAAAALKLRNEEFLKTFEISIQLGAILAIVFLYARRLLGNMLLYKKLATAFVPTAILGFLAYKIIKTYLFNPIVVSMALILGGLVLILVDKIIPKRAVNHAQVEDISYRSAFMIGLCQSISMIPGVSRAAATIIGGMCNGLDKKQAMEFSFLLAIPTMCAATGYDLLKTSTHWTGDQFMMLTFGAVIAFLSAWAAVKFFLAYVEKNGFALFGYYRIVLGMVFLGFFL